MRLAIAFWLAQALTFDVASVRPSQPPEGEPVRRGITATPTGITVVGSNLLDCIQWAYQVREYQVFGPDWIRVDRYDIHTRTASPATPNDLRAMLQALLADRFGLRLHRDRKEMPVYALTPGRREPKLTRSTHPEQRMLRLPGGGLRLDFQRTTLSELAGFLSTLSAVGRPVEDRSGLAGAYDFRLDLHELSEPTSPAFVTIFEEQLGLRLDGRRSLVEVLVVDRIERPAAN